MEEIKEAKLVTYICPTCGTPLKFPPNSKTTICPSCKNEVEKQITVNLNFASGSDTSTFENCYSYDNSLFKIQMDENLHKFSFSGLRQREFIDVPNKILEPSDAIKLEALIQQLIYKVGKPNKIKNLDELYRVVNEIGDIDRKNIYYVFFYAFLNKDNLDEALTRKDSLDKAEVFVPYLVSNNTKISRNYDNDIFSVTNYILNTNMPDTEKYSAISTIFSERYHAKHHFTELAQTVLAVLSFDIKNDAKQNFVKKFAEISLLNDYNSLAQYLQICLKVELPVDGLFTKRYLRTFLYGIDGEGIAYLINFIATREELNEAKKTSYIKSILKLFLFQYANNLTSNECAELIVALKDKNLPNRFKNKCYERIVLLSLVDRINVAVLSKMDNNKIKKQIRKSKKESRKNNGSFSGLWNFWDTYWWKLPFRLLIGLSLAGVIIAGLLHSKSTGELETIIAEKGLFLHFVKLFVAGAVVACPMGAILTVVLAPVWWLVLCIAKLVSPKTIDLKTARLEERRKAIQANYDRQSKDVMRTKEFENSQLIAFLIELDMDAKTKKSLIDLIKIPYFQTSYDTVLNLLDLVSRSNYSGKAKLYDYLVHNCLRVETYQEALIVVEFLKRDYNLDADTRAEYIKFIINERLKSNITSVSGYLHLFSYLTNPAEEFRNAFKVFCINNKDLFYQLINFDVMYSAGEMSDDIYLLACKCMQKFAITSVTHENLSKVETETTEKLKLKGIKEFSPRNAKENKRIVRWLKKKPLTKKSIRKDCFLKATLRK